METASVFYYGKTTLAGRGDHSLMLNGQLGSTTGFSPTKITTLSTRIRQDSRQLEQAGPLEQNLDRIDLSGPQGGMNFGGPGAGLDMGSWQNAWNLGNPGEASPGGFPLTGLDSSQTPTAGLGTPSGLGPNFGSNNGSHMPGFEGFAGIGVPGFGQSGSQQETGPEGGLPGSKFGSAVSNGGSGLPSLDSVQAVVQFSADGVKVGGMVGQQNTGVGDQGTSGGGLVFGGGGVDGASTSPPSQGDSLDGATPPDGRPSGPPGSGSSGPAEPNKDNGLSPNYAGRLDPPPGMKEFKEKQAEAKDPALAEARRQVTQPKSGEENTGTTKSPGSGEGGTTNESNSTNGDTNGSTQPKDSSDDPGQSDGSTMPSEGPTLAELKSYAKFKGVDLEGGRDRGPVTRPGPDSDSGSGQAQEPSAMGNPVEGLVHRLEPQSKLPRNEELLRREPGEIDPRFVR